MNLDNLKDQSTKNGSQFRNDLFDIGVLLNYLTSKEELIVFADYHHPKQDDAYGWVVNLLQYLTDSNDADRELAVRLECVLREEDLTKVKALVKGKPMFPKDKVANNLENSKYDWG